MIAPLFAGVCSRHLQAAAEVWIATDLFTGRRRHLLHRHHRRQAGRRFGTGRAACIDGRKRLETGGLKVAVVLVAVGVERDFIFSFV
jgi:hypothetical protein